MNQGKLDLWIKKKPNLSLDVDGSVNPESSAVSSTSSTVDDSAIEKQTETSLKSSVSSADEILRSPTMLHQEPKEGCVTSVSVTVSSSCTSVVIKPEFLHFMRRGVNSRRYVRCIPCVTFQEKIKHMLHQGNLPGMCTENGVLYRERTVLNQFGTDYHEVAERIHRLSSLPPAEAAESSEIGQAISKANAILGNKIGGLMLHVYNDAKKLTLSATTFPSRVVTSQFASRISFNDYKEPDTSSLSFQYITPASHRELLQCIVDAHKKKFFQEAFSNALAVSLRCDGSVDRTRIDKIYIIAKVINSSGTQMDYFLGAQEPQERGAIGVFNAIQDSFAQVLGDEHAKLLFKSLSSIVTDGASVNTGERSGLWTLLENYLETQFQDNHPPLVKYWCAAHRSNLAWKSVRDAVPAVKKIIKTLTSISTFFHTSGTRTKELKDIAALNGFDLVSFPPYFEVRWSEFCMQLLESILRSWQSLVHYFRYSKESGSSGFLKFLTAVENLELITFLADMLTVFSRYQKRLQCNEVTVFDVERLTFHVKAHMTALLHTPLLGGWVATLEESKNRDENGTLQLNEITLTESDPSSNRRPEHQFHVTALKNELVQSMNNFLETRFSIDTPVLQIIKPYAKLSNEADLKVVWEAWGRDLSLEELNLEFQDILSFDQIEKLRAKDLSELVLHFASSKHYKNTATLLARFLAAKPHSADVERLISSSVSLKSPDRSRMKVDTENLNLHVYCNMPPLEKWDPREAVALWIKRDRRVKDCSKSREQYWYRGIFHEAAKREQYNDNDFSDDSENETIPRVPQKCSKKKRFK